MPKKLAGWLILEKKTRKQIRTIEIQEKKEVKPLEKLLLVGSVQKPQQTEGRGATGAASSGPRGGRAGGGPLSASWLSVVEVVCLKKGRIS